METQETGRGKTVCVTGAGGFYGSWMVSQLLERGYHVRGTVRHPENEEKNGHLWKMKGANERLQLFKADVLDYDAVALTVAGCAGVFHTACPVVVDMDDPEKEMIQPCVQGTLNVLKASFNAKVGRVIYTASILTMMYNKENDGKLCDETCWSDPDFYQSIGYWYCVAKVQAERAAWKFAEEKGLDLISISPATTFGPTLQKETNLSSAALLNVFLGSKRTFSYVYCGPVDVRDVAAAHILLFETPSASGRYICAERFAPFSEIMEGVAKLYPDENIPQAEGDTQPWLVRSRSPSMKLLELGFVFRPHEQTLIDSFACAEERGLITPKAKSKRKVEKIVESPGIPSDVPSPPLSP